MVNEQPCFKQSKLQLSDYMFYYFQGVSSGWWKIIPIHLATLLTVFVIIFDGISTINDNSNRNKGTIIIIMLL